MFHIFAALAEFERGVIRERTLARWLSWCALHRHQKAMIGLQAVAFRIQ